jgi:putative transcriptional regulator
MGISPVVRARSSLPAFHGVSAVLDVSGDCNGRSALEVPMKNRLRVLRAEREWSQADLADRLEVSRQSVNAIETGKYDPSLPLAFRIARLFESSIEAIFTDED